MIIYRGYTIEYDGEEKWWIIKLDGVPKQVKATEAQAYEWIDWHMKRISTVRRST